MAKENVNVADELKDEKQKANLTQSAKEAEAAQAIAETDTDEEETTATEPNEPQLPKIYVKRKRYTKIGRASCREECRSRWSPYH